MLSDRNLSIQASETQADNDNGIQVSLTPLSAMEVEHLPFDQETAHSELPNEMWLYVAGYLEPGDIVALACVNKYFRALLVGSYREIFAKNIPQLEFIVSLIRYLFSSSMETQELPRIRDELVRYSSRELSILSEQFPNSEQIQSHGFNKIAPLWTKEEIEALTEEESTDIKLSKNLFFYSLFPSASMVKYLLEDLLKNIDLNASSKDINPFFYEFYHKKLRKILFGALGNEKIGDNALLFTFLAKSGHLDIIKMLFKYLTEEEIKTILAARSLEIFSPIPGAAVPATIKIGYRSTPVWRAAQNGHRETVDYLLEQHSFGSTADDYFRLVCELSKEIMDREVLDPLLEQYVSLYNGLQHTLPPISGLTSIIYKGDIKTIAYLLDKNFIPETGEHGQSSFFAAVLNYKLAHSRRIALIELFLKKTLLTLQEIEHLLNILKGQDISKNENILYLAMDNVIASISSSLPRGQKIQNVAHPFLQITCPDLSSIHLDELFKKAGSLLSLQDKERLLDYHATRQAIAKAIQGNDLETFKNTDLRKLSATEMMCSLILGGKLELVNYYLQYLRGLPRCYFDILSKLPYSKFSLLRLGIQKNVDISILEALIKYDVSLTNVSHFTPKLLIYIEILKTFLKLARKSKNEADEAKDRVNAILKILIKQYIDKQIQLEIFLSISWGQGSTFLLEEAIKLGNFPLIRFLIGQNVKLHATNFNPQLLNYITFLDRIKNIQPTMMDDILKTLAEQCVNERVQFDIFAPISLSGGRITYLLKEALSLEDSEIIKFLIEQDIKYNSKEGKLSAQQIENYWHIIKTNIDKFNFIMPTIKKHCTNWDDLIEYKKRSTFLHIAILEASRNKENAPLLEIIKIMVKEYGANVNAEKVGPYTPLHGIIIARNINVVKKIEIIKLFLEHKVDINQRHKDGETPLFAAALRLTDQKDAIKICVLLINNGADFTIKNNEGLTVLDKAREKNRNIVVNFLQEVQSTRANAQQLQAAPSLNPPGIGVAAVMVPFQSSLAEPPTDVAAMEMEEDKEKTQASKRKSVFTSPGSPVLFSSKGDSASPPKKIKLDQTEESKMRVGFLLSMEGSTSDTQPPRPSGS